MANKATTAAPANILARLKTKPAKPQHRIPIETAAEDEGRRSRRQSACLQASILSARLSEAVPCVVRNLSATGARVELVVKSDKKPFVAEERLPDAFILALRLERTEVECEIVWQRGNTLGVRFLSLPRLAKS